MKNASSFLIFVAILWLFGNSVLRLLDKAFILPSPIQILVRLWELKDVLLLEHLPVTLLTIIIGLIISIILGTAIAVWMSSNSKCSKSNLSNSNRLSNDTDYCASTDFRAVVWLYNLE